MIGPTSTFYDEEDVRAGPRGVQYGDWVAAYESARHQQQPQHPASQHQQPGSEASQAQHSYHFSPQAPIDPSFSSSTTMAYNPHNPHSQPTRQQGQYLFGVDDQYSYTFQPEAWTQPPRTAQQQQGLPHQHHDRYTASPAISGSHSGYEPAHSMPSTSPMDGHFTGEHPLHNPQSYFSAPVEPDLKQAMGPQQHKPHIQAKQTGYPTGHPEYSSHALPPPSTSVSQSGLQHHPAHRAPNPLPGQLPNPAQGVRGPVQVPQLQQLGRQVTPPMTNRSHKRPRQSNKGSRAPRPRRPVSEEDDGSDDDETDGFGRSHGASSNAGGISVGMGGMGVSGSGGRAPPRLPGACKNCKRLKMRCEFEKDDTDNTCKRCKAGGVICIVEGRKRRETPNKREYLLAQIRQKDAIIESLLRQIHNPYTATPMSIASYRMAISPSDENNKDIISWLDLLQTSLKTGTSNVSPPILTSPTSGVSGTTAGASFQNHRGTDAVMGDDDSDTESPNNETSRTNKKITNYYGLQTDDDSGMAGDSYATSGSSSSHRSGAGVPGLGDPEEEEDSKIKIQQNLPDEVVPLGLIANLALDDAKSDKTLTKRHNVSAHSSSQNVSSDLGASAGTPGSASASASTPGGRGAQGARHPVEDVDEEDVGVASSGYFLPGPASDLRIRATMIEQYSPPEILVHGLVSPTDVNKLFEIFYEKLNPFISLLDPVLHTPASTFARCPFLFTVICAVSSRYYAEKSEIYPIAMHFAKHAAANALIDGWKSVELCQAYIIMSIWGVPAKRWEEDRSWLYTGLAIRIATDLNLHQLSGNVDSGSTSAAGPRTRGSSSVEHGGSGANQRLGPDGKVVISASERQEREILNRTRVWMICFNLDRSTATQFGKPITVKEDFAMRNQADWHTRSKYNHPFDVHLCAYTALVRIVARFHDEVFSDTNTPSGLNQGLDFKDVTQRHSKALSEYHETWQRTFDQWSDNDDPGSAFRCKLLPFLVAYSRLVMWSFGFQKAFKEGMKQDDLIFLEESMNAAKTILKVMIESLAPSGYMKNSPDGHFVFCSFASAFLLKLLRPECSKFLSKDQETEIFNLIGRLIQILSGPEIAIDDRHTPKLYARFLAGLLGRYRRDGATVGRLHPQPPSSNTGGGNPEYPSFGGPSAGPASGSFPSQGSTSGGSGGHTGMEGGYHNFSLNMAGMNGSHLQQQDSFQQKMGTPIYRTEASFGVDSNGGSLAISLGDPMDTTNFDNPDFADEELLATMKALKNPEWWDNMMMPGFTWPQMPMASPVHGAFSDYSTSDASPLSPMGYHHSQLVS